MTGINRRDAFGLAPAGGAATTLGTAQAAAASAVDLTWRRGHDGQRIADLGDGRLLNPLTGGDRPDPAILRDGDDYYMTFSSFDSYPGLTIWHSRDLLNWTPRAAALTRNIGAVWAVSLARHAGGYFLYIPVKATPNDIFVSWADHIDGPWSGPVSLGLHRHIDPCYAVGEDRSRWLFLSGGDRIRLAPDGLSTVGAVEHVYDPWRYPDNWDVEGGQPGGAEDPSPRPTGST